MIELNEAFASQSLADSTGWRDLDSDRVNIHRGALAIAHSLAASGSRVIGHVAQELKRRGGGVTVWRLRLCAPASGRVSLSSLNAERESGGTGYA